MRHERRESLAGDSTQFLFSESMRKTREAVRQCGVCFCAAAEGDDEDRYAEEVLTTEIETLKRTVKEVRPCHELASTTSLYCVREAILIFVGIVNIYVTRYC